MSKFYGTLLGRGLPKTSCGNTHISVVAQSWEGSVEVEIYQRERGGHGCAIMVDKGSTDEPKVTLWNGTLEELLKSAGVV